jgi:hypothetical protein
MVPSLKVEPQWSPQMRLMLIKGWKGGKRWVLGRWSRQMSFKMSSSRRVERECPLGVAKKAKGKALG